MNPYAEVPCRGVVLFRTTRHGLKCRPSRLSEQRLSTLDPDGTYVCKSCAMTEKIVNYNIKQLSAAGFEAPTTWAGYEEQLRMWRTGAAGRAWRAAQRQKAKSALAARKGNPGGRGDRLGWAVMARTWRGRSRLASEGERPARRRLDLCLWCGLLIMMSTAKTARQTRFHDACRDEAIRTDEGRRWFSKMLDLRRNYGMEMEKVYEFLGPLPGPRHRGRRRQTGELTRDFGWAVRHLLGGDPQTQLARESQVSVSTVSRGIAGILDLLAPADRVDRQFQKYVVALRSAAKPST